LIEFDEITMTFVILMKFMNMFGWRVKLTKSW